MGQLRGMLKKVLGSDLDTCVMCFREIPEERRGFLVNVCSDACDAEEQASRPF